MDDILTKIVDLKKEELFLETRQQSLKDLQTIILDLPPTRGFLQALKSNAVNIIAELKKASPSKGVMCENFNPQALAVALENAGAVALSVLTEKNFFLGSLEYLKDVRRLVKIPLLRKDFIFDEYQIFQARAFGADAVLLIAAMLDKQRFKELYDLAKSLNLNVLSEAHTLDEIKMLEELDVEMIGINARNLRTFHTDLEMSLSFVSHIDQKRVVVAESAIKTHEDIQKFTQEGVSAFLIGETLMTSADIQQQMHRLMYG